MANFDTKVVLLNTPLVDNKNQITFSAIREQEKYFLSREVKSFESLNYYNSNKRMKIACHVDSIVSVNYVMYRNTEFSNKWYYGFVKNKNYISNNATEIVFELDSFQTFQFDIEYLQSFIVRKHVENDTIGLHLLDEGLELGNFVQYDYRAETSCLNLCCLIQAAPIPQIQGDFHSSMINNVVNGLTNIIVYGNNIANDVSDIVKLYTENGKYNNIVNISMIPQNFLPFKLTDLLPPTGGGSGGAVGVEPSKNIIYYLKSIEGFAPNTYRDSGGVLTGGYGLTGSHLDGVNFPISENQATSLLKEKFNLNYWNRIHNKFKVDGITLNQDQTDSMASFAYNIGVYGFWESDLYNLLKNGETGEKIHQELLLYNKDANGNVQPGLTRRREEEWKIFSGNHKTLGGYGVAPSIPIIGNGGSITGTLSDNGGYGAEPQKRINLERGFGTLPNKTFESKWIEFKLPSTTPKIKDYNPRNKKLLTSPYTFLKVGNNTGETLDLKLEKLEESTFSIFSTFGTNPIVICLPNKYNGKTTPVENSLSISDFPICSWSCDSYAQYISQNRSRIDLANFNLGKSLVTGNIGSSSVQGIKNSKFDSSPINGVISQLATMDDMKRQSDSAGGSMTGGSLNVQMQRQGFTFSYQSIEKTRAEIIDKFFDIFGYKVNTVEKPKLKTRKNFNYIQTENINIKGEMDNNALKDIQEMFNTGVTLWHNPSNFCNYDIENGVV